MNILDWIKVLESLSDKEKEELSFFCQEKYLNKWEILFKEWEEWNVVYILKSWSFEVSKNINWEEIILWKVYPEEILWEMALFWQNHKRTATVKCIESWILIAILSNSILKISENNPDLLEKIKTVIINRIDENKLKY